MKVGNFGDRSSGPYGGRGHTLPNYVSSSNIMTEEKALTNYQETKLSRRVKSETYQEATGYKRLVNSIKHSGGKA